MHNFLRWCGEEPEAPHSNLPRLDLLGQSVAKAVREARAPENAPFRRRGGPSCILICIYTYISCFVCLIFLSSGWASSFLGLHSFEPCLRGGRSAKPGVRGDIPPRRPCSPCRAWRGTTAHASSRGCAPRKIGLGHTWRSAAELLGSRLS